MHPHGTHQISLRHVSQQQASMFPVGLVICGIQQEAPLHSALRSAVQQLGRCSQQASNTCLLRRKQCCSFRLMLMMVHNTRGSNLQALLPAEISPLLTGCESRVTLLVMFQKACIFCWTQ